MGFGFAVRHSVSSDRTLRSFASEAKRQTDSPHEPKAKRLPIHTQFAETREVSQKRVLQRKHLAQVADEVISLSLTESKVDRLNNEKEPTI